MTAVSLILLLSDILFYVFTREAFVYVIYSNGLIIEFHLVIFSLVLTENQNKTKSLKPKINFYRALIKRISALSEKSVIRIKTIRLNKLKSLLSADKIIGSFGYHAAISALLAYFYQKSKKLITEENALVLIPDTNESSFVDIRLSTELYNIVFALLRLFFDLNKSRRKGKI